MGIREWGFMVRNKQDLNHVIDLIKRYNVSKHSCDSLTMTLVFIYKSEIWLCCVTTDASSSVSDFMDDNYEGPKMEHGEDHEYWWSDLENQKNIWMIDKKDYPNMFIKRNGKYSINNNYNPTQLIFPSDTIFD